MAALRPSHIASNYAAKKLQMYAARAATSVTGPVKHLPQGTCPLLPSALPS